MNKIIDWLNKLSERAERNRETIGLADDSFLGRLVDKADQSAETLMEREQAKSEE